MNNNMFINELNEIEKIIYTELYNYSSYENPLTHKHFEKFDIDKRYLAASIREMNEKYKGKFHIGSSKKGYWLCRNEKEAIASLLSYNQIILSMLGERKKIKEQIKETFSNDFNLFGEKVLFLPKKLKEAI